jgi:hypothetical protein
MNLKNPLKTCLFFSLLCFLGSVSIYAYAPDSLADKKMTLTVASKYHDMEWYILEDGTNVWAHEIEDGEWELGNLSWSKTSTYQGTLQLGPDNDYVLITATFTSSNAGTFTYTLHESENGGPVEVVDSGTGSFTLGDYDISDIPFDNYFEDDFTSNQVSQAIWPLGTAYGITIGVKDNALQLTGTLNDEIDDQRWYAFSASSILSTANDWKVSGSSFAKIDVQNDFLNYQAATGVELRNSKTNGLDFEISIGLTPWGIRSEIYVGDYDNYDSQYHSTGVGGGVLQEGDFRVVNDSSNKTITTQYLSGSEWETLYELNWDSGILADKINNSETQLNPWTSFSTEYALPTMDFVIPHTDQDWNGENIQVYSLSDGDLGFKNYSVTETTSEPIPEYVPSSLVGKIYQGSDNDHYQFLDTSKAIFYHKESNFQESEISEITYTWTESGNTGTLTTSLDEITTLTFSSETEGSSVRQEEGSNNTSSGTFSLADSSAGNAPDDLSGDTMIFGTSTYIFKDNGVVTIRTTTGSEESTYGYVKSNNDAGTLSIPAQTDNASSTLYRMSFTSSSSGTLSEGGSGSFEYFIDGSNQPSSKGWMWFDQYPWVYSEIEQGWIYFYPSGSKLLAFSVKDQAWREME